MFILIQIDKHFFWRIRKTKHTIRFVLGFLEIDLCRITLGNFITLVEIEDFDRVFKDFINSGEVADEKS